MSWRLPKDIPQETLMSFYTLKRDPNFTRIMEWLKSGYAEEQHRVAVVRDEVDLRQCQGIMQVLETIIGANENAEALLLQLQKAPLKGGGR